MMPMLNENELREKLKRRHDIMGDEQDILINDIIDDAISHYLAIANQLSDDAITTIPEKHAFIISDVASMRYVRRGSEGMEIERVDGYQAQYQSSKSDFDSFLGLMEKEYKTDERNQGRMTWY